MTDKSLTHEDKIKYIKTLIEKEQFCMLPFVNLNTNTNGKLKLCCNIHTERHISHGSSDSYVDYNFGKDSIDDIWNGGYMTHVRYSMLKDEKVDDCVGCKKQEENTGFSPRMGQNNKWLVLLADDHNLLNDVYDNISNFRKKQHLGNKPYSYELRLGNQCNLKCSTCWSLSSNQIHTERKELLEKNAVPDFLKGSFEYEVAEAEKNSFKWYETEEFFDNFEKSVKDLKRLYTTGGEPTLIKANYKILEKLIAAENFDCKIEFTTNMTTFNSEFYDRLEKFNKVEAQVSIDGIGDYAGYIRYPSVWKTVDKNFEKLLEIARNKPNWTIVIYTVYQAMNYDQLPQIWKYLKDKSEKYQVRITWWPIVLDYPPYLSLSVLEKEQRVEIIDNLVSLRKSLITHMFWISDSAFDIVSGSLYNLEYKESENEKFKNWLEFNDKTRNIDSKRLLRWVK